jgi:cyclic lactone autoinducer peptide
MGFLSKIFGMVANLSISNSNSECIIWLYDEPECPKSIIEK